MSLGVAIVGAGRMGGEHARAFRGAGCRIAWVHDVSPEAAERLAREHDARVAPDLGALLGDPGTHVVSIASFDDVHGEQARLALEARKHVFCEKPLCYGEDQLARIVEARARSGTFLASNLVLRAAPLHVWLDRAVSDGTLGEIYAIDGDYLYGRIERITDGWRKDVADYSVLLGGGVHLLDLALGLARERPSGVSASGNRIATRGTPFRYLDFAAAAFTFPSGLVARITANFGCVHPHQHVLRVFGTKGTFLHDDQGARLHLSRDPASAPTRILEAPLPASKGALVPGFVEAILAGQDPVPRARREVDLIAACLAADRSLATGKAGTIDAARVS